MTRGEELLGRRPSALLLVGHDGGKSVSSAKQSTSTVVGLLQYLGHDDLAVIPGRVEDAVHLVLEHHRDRVVLGCFVALGVGDEKHVAVLPGLVLRAVDDLAGERGGGDRVGDEADESGCRP